MFLWNCVKKVLLGQSAAVQLKLPIVSPDEQMAMQCYSEIEVGSTVVYTPGNGEPIVGTVEGRYWRGRDQEMYSMVHFEKPINQIVEAEASFLTQYLRAPDLLDVPAVILRKSPSFKIIDQSAESAPRSTTTLHLRLRPAPPVQPVLRLSTSAVELDQHTTTDGNHVAATDPSSSNSSKYGGSYLLSLIQSNDGVKQDAVTREHKFTWALDTKPEFIVPSINFKEFERSEGQKGIQGRSNSCYLDSTLTSLFAFTSVFDSSLLSEDTHHDAKNSEDNEVGVTCGSDSNNASQHLSSQVQNLLSKHIVNQLRQDYFCPAAPIMHLRKLLLPVNSKVGSAFMDPEEFMFILFDEVLHLKEFIHYDNDNSDFLHQINLEPGSRIRPFITTQRLLELSMKNLKLKFRQIPAPGLILEMPRSDGKLLNGLQGIIPNLTIDVTNSVVDAPRHCVSCNDLASIECLECFDLFRYAETGSDSTSYCSTCYSRCHMHPLRRHHSAGNPLTYPPASETTRSRIKLHLLAVICIRSYHFVSFVRTASSKESPWVFFDSNPTGQYPFCEILPEFGQRLTELEMMAHNEILRTWTDKGSMLRRIVEDGHICIYSHQPE